MTHMSLNLTSTPELNCPKPQGSTKGEDLAEAIEGMVAHHDLQAVCTTDREPKKGSFSRTSAAAITGWRTL